MYTGEKVFRCDSATSSFYFLNDDELEYMELIQDKIHPFFPTFATAILQQSPAEREQGRCVMVEFAGEDGSQVTSLGDSAEIQNYFESTSGPRPTNPLSDHPKRRLFILEDLPCNQILALGSRLRIPPSFFAGHYDDPVSSTFNHRSPFCRSTRSKSQFRLRYATSNRFEVDTSHDTHNNMYAFNTNACRYIQAYKPGGLLYDEARSHHILSFWSSPVREDGSWDAVLLVDPPLGEYVKCLPSRQLVKVRRQLRDEGSMPKRFLYPELDISDELPQNSSQWTEYYAQPEYNSMLDDTVRMLMLSKSHETRSVEDPMDAVKIPRKLVISILTAWLRRRYLNLLDIQKNTSNTLRHNYLCSFSEGSLSSWHEEFFDFVVGACAAMKVFSGEIEENITALGLNDPEVGGAKSPPQWEADGWASVRELTGIVDGMVNAFSTGYMQYISIQEARVSNCNAQSLSRITVLTMLFIPLSTVASIFSVGDEFLPGQAKAWVFWVVAIPVLLVLMYLYWYQHLVGLMKKRKQLLLPLFERTCK